MKILALLQELKYLKLQLENKVEFQYTGACQFESSRPIRPEYKMTSQRDKVGQGVCRQEF